jgi:CRISPR/Cas system-associated exonuclease Cas4 (RecB family)
LASENAKFAGSIPARFVVYECVRNGEIMSIEKHLIDEPNAAYHSRPELSASQLKKFAESPRIFEAYHVTKSIASEPSPAMRLGSAVHTAVLERVHFHRDYVVCPAECSDKRTKAYKDWSAGVDATKTVLTDDEYLRVMQCALAVESNETSRAIINASTHVEKSFAYDDFLTGVECRVRFDAIAGDVVVDLKTVSDGSQTAFESSVAKFGYHLQAAHYLEGLRTIDPDRNWRFVFITLETQAPFRCRVFELSDDSLNFASMQRMALLEDYKRRMATGDWSEVGEKEVTVLSLPRWYMTQKAFE